MKASEFLPAVHAVFEKLRARPDMFDVTPPVIAPPVTEAELSRVEKELRFRLPETLRDIYTQACASVELDWVGRRGKLVELGCDPGDEPRGSATLVPPADLVKMSPRTPDAPEGTRGFVQFTIARGGGYCLYRPWED